MMLLLLFLLDQFGNVARLGDLRQVDLRAHFCRTGSLPGGRGAGFGHKMLPYLLGFIIFHRAGMGLFLSNPHFRKDI
jgi:hypothetical protein